MSNRSSSLIFLIIMVSFSKISIRQFSQRGGEIIVVLIDPRETLMIEYIRLIKTLI